MAGSMDGDGRTGADVPAPAAGRSGSRTDDSSRGDAVLWAVAAGLAALVIMQAGRVDEASPPTPTPTSALSSAVTGDGFSVVAGRSGRGDDADPDELIWVLDSRSGAILVYEVEDPRLGSVVFRQGGSLDALFRTATRP
jgi:hypothetical protein